MKFITLVAIVSLLANPVFANTRNLNEIVDQADPKETEDLAKVLNDINLTPTKDPQTGKTVYKVEKVAPGSLYEKAGVKAGDFLSQENSDSSMKLEAREIIRGPNVEEESDIEIE